MNALTTETIRTVCEWLGLPTWIETELEGIPLHMGIETSSSQFLLGITDDTIDADGDLFGFALEVMAAVNSREDLHMTTGCMSVSLYDYYNEVRNNQPMDERDPTSIATAIIKLAERRALWEGEQG